MFQVVLVGRTVQVQDMPPILTVDSVHYVHLEHRLAVPRLRETSGSLGRICGIGTLAFVPMLAFLQLAFDSDTTHSLTTYTGAT